MPDVAEECVQVVLGPGVHVEVPILDVPDEAANAAWTAGFVGRHISNREDDVSCGHLPVRPPR